MYPSAPAIAKTMMWKGAVEHSRPKASWSTPTFSLETLTCKQTVPTGLGARVPYTLGSDLNGRSLSRVHTANIDIQNMFPHSPLCKYSLTC